MAALLTTLFLVTVAEMGDKTQLLAMALAARFKLKEVLLGILAATAANHLFAVIAGNYLGSRVPVYWVQVVASISFVVFGLWTLRGDKLEGEEKRQGTTPFVTVFVAFFLAEFGDKTQLATAALAAKYNSVIPVWIGSSTGLIVADILGIMVGKSLSARLSERFIKVAAAAVFIGFGLIGLYSAAA